MANIRFTVVTNAVRAAGTPADGEFVWTSDTKQFYRGDGTTQGGIPISSSGVTDGGTLSVGITIPNTGLKIQDTDASHALTIAPGSNLTAARTLTITTGDASRTLDISAGNVTVSSASATLLGQTSTTNWRSSLGLAIGTDVQAYNANLASISSLTDPNADRIAFWDDSAGAWAWLTLGTGLTITGTTLDASGGGGGVSDGATLATGLTFPNTGFKVQDTNASHALTIKPGSDLTAARTLTIATGDADRTLNISSTNVTITSKGAEITSAVDSAAVRTAAGLGTAATMAGPSGAIVGTTDTQTLTNKTLGATALNGTLDGGGQEIGRHLNRVVTGVSGTLTTTSHSGCIIKTSGNVTVPTTAGFNCVIIAGGAHTVTFNGTTSAAMAAGDVMTVFVESATVIHAVKTAAADKVTFA